MQARPTVMGSDRRKRLFSVHPVPWPVDFGQVPSKRFGQPGEDHRVRQLRQNSVSTTSSGLPATDSNGRVIVMPARQ